MPVDHGLQLSPASGSAALTPEQKRFNALIRQIDQARRTLAAWQANVALYAQARARVLVPLIREFVAERKAWLFALDRLLDEPGWSRAERATLRELIRETAAQLIDAEGIDEADEQALKALFDKHGEVDFDTGQRQARAAMKHLAEAITGLDLGDMTGIASDEDLLRRMHESMAAAEAREEEQAQARAAAAPARRRRKTAAQEKREAEAQLATQSVREVFRKLASALHPDRETDAGQRAAKTALMQKVNQAYAAGDLLALLELQLQIEQIDAAHLAGAGAQRIRHYNKVLAEQLASLKADIEHAEMAFRMDFGLQPGSGLDPAKLTRFVDEDARLLRVDTAAARREARVLADRAATRRWLKREQRRLRDEAAMFDDGFS